MIHTRDPEILAAQTVDNMTQQRRQSQELEQAAIMAQAASQMVPADWVPPASQAMGAPVITHDAQGNVVGRPTLDGVVQTIVVEPKAEPIKQKRAGKRCKAVDVQPV